MSDVILVANDSRYKSTSVYETSDRNGVEFALFEEPSDFVSITNGYGQHRVRQHEIGFLDLLAVRYFGPRSENLWWVIALVNGIIDPEQEMYPGMILYIPPSTVISNFLSSKGS